VPRNAPSKPERRRIARSAASRTAKRTDGPPTKATRIESVQHRSQARTRRVEAARAATTTAPRTRPRTRCDSKKPQQPHLRRPHPATVIPIGTIAGVQQKTRGPRRKRCRRPRHRTETGRDGPEHTRTFVADMNTRRDCIEGRRSVEKNAEGGRRAQQAAGWKKSGRSKPQTSKHSRGPRYVSAGSACQGPSQPQRRNRRPPAARRGPSAEYGTASCRRLPNDILRGQPAARNAGSSGRPGVVGAAEREARKRSPRVRSPMFRRGRRASCQDRRTRTRTTASRRRPTQHPSAQ